MIHQERANVQTISASVTAQQQARAKLAQFEFSIRIPLRSKAESAVELYQLELGRAKLAQFEFSIRIPLQSKAESAHSTAAWQSY